MKLNIIIIDDCDVQLALSSRLIKKNSNLNLIGAYSDPFLGLQAVNNQDVDVVLLDVEMPVINGFALQQLFNASVEVIINSSQEYFELQAYINGALDFLQKPLSSSKICGSVARVLEMKKIKANQEIAKKNLACKLKVNGHDIHSVLSD